MLTLGRLPKALDLARAFAGAGHRVIVAEPHRWHLTRMSRAVHRCVQVPAPDVDADAYLDGLRDVVTRHGVDTVVPVSEEILHASALAQSLPDGVRMTCMPQPRLLALHHKLRFAQRARALGLDAPATLALSDPAAADLARAGPVVVKPALGCAGRGVQVLARGSALPVPEAAHPAVVQAFVEGTLLCSFSIAHEGEALVTVVYRGTVMSGTVAVCFERVDGAAAVERWVERLVAAERFSGFIGFDFVVDADGRAFAIECNPRATSGVHFVEASDLAAAVLEPEAGRPVRLRAERVLQQFWPCLTETQAAMLRARSFRHHLGELLRAKDVTFSARDPLPLWLMPFASYPILALTLFRGLSFGEAATRDIEWHGALPETT